MAITITSETDTVIKRVLPYLQRRGYTIETDLSFEAPALRQERHSIGYVDLLVTMGKSRPALLMEAKRAGRKLTVKDRDQAISYGRYHAVPFVVVTNGDQMICYNTATKEPIRWNGSALEKIPSRDQVAGVLRSLKATRQLPSSRSESTAASLTGQG